MGRFQDIVESFFIRVPVDKSSHLTWGWSKAESMLPNNEQTRDPRLWQTCART